MDTLLFRSVSFRQTPANETDDGLTLEGYAAVFGSPTRIDSWEGCFDETIARGAFKRSLSERSPVLQFDHGRHPMVGSIPLGSFESLTEDDQGLYVKARLHDNWLVQPVRDAIRSESVSGMSFRFQVVKDEWRTADGKTVKPEDVGRLLYSSDPGDPSSVLQRTLREVKCPELGPVVFPAYPDTSVSVRSRELASLFTDPQVRDELARILVGTPSESSEPVRGSDEGRAAATAEVLPEGTPGKPVHIPSLAARARGLEQEGIVIITPKEKSHG